MGSVWGDFLSWLSSLNPSWVSAIASCLTVLVSLAAFCTAVWAARAAWKQLEHLKEQKEIEQASKISGWLAVESDHEAGTFQVNLRFVNASRLPVHQVLVQPVALEADEAMLELAEPTEKIVTIPLDFATQRAKELIARETEKSLRELDPEEHFLAEPAAYAFARAVLLKQGTVLWFRDSQNRTWIRRANGTLEPPKLDRKGNYVDGRALIRHPLEWPVES